MTQLEEIVRLRPSQFMLKYSSLDDDDKFDLENKIDFGLKDLIKAGVVSEDEPRGLTVSRKHRLLINASEHFKANSRAAQNLQILRVVMGVIDNVMSTMFSLEKGLISYSVSSCESYIYHNLVLMEKDNPSSNENIGTMLIDKLESFPPFARVIAMVTVMTIMPIIVAHLAPESDHKESIKTLGGIMGNGINGGKESCLLKDGWKLYNSLTSKKSSSSPKIANPNNPIFLGPSSQEKSDDDPPFCD